MSQCVVINTGGQLETSAADPCTTLVVLTPAEYGAMSANPFVLTPEDGLLISAAVVTVWAAAWSWKALVWTLKDHGEEGS